MGSNFGEAVTRSRIISPFPLAPLVPSPLAYSGLEVRCSGDILARVLHGGTDLGTV